MVSCQDDLGTVKMGDPLEREARFQPSYFACHPKIRVCGLHFRPPARDALNLQRVKCLDGSPQCQEDSPDKVIT
jgi:hypothetical protein